MLRMSKKLLEFMRTHYRKEVIECVFEEYGIHSDSTVTSEDNINP